jgi:hypothetical protein
MPNIHPVLSPPPNLPSDEDESNGNSTPTNYETTIATYYEAHHQAGYTLCPPLPDTLIDVMPPAVSKALLDNKDVNVIIGTLDGNPGYNPAI